MRRTTSASSKEVGCDIASPVFPGDFAPAGLPGIEGEFTFLTTSEVSAFLRIPEGTLRYWRHAGIGPRSLRLGRRVVYRSDDVNAYVQAETSRTERGSGITQTA